MQPQFSPSYYSDPEVYDREQRTLFRDQWQFMAFTHELENHNDYVARDIGGQSVVVQNLDGQLNCFENVCSHRFNRIHSDGCGNRRLQCRYHGWIYNGEGFPCAIPHRPRFDDLTEDKVRELQLTRWQVETCGGLVFVREGVSGRSLREFLGEIHDDMEQYSLALGPQIDRNEMIIEANWKILVENTLEGYHVDFVHEETFRRLGTVNQPKNWEWSLPHSRYSSPLSEKFDADCRKVTKLLSDRPVTIDGYLHQLVFPNLTLATTYGTSFSVQHFEPLGPERTRFTSYVFQTKLAGDVSGVRAVMLDTINHSVREFNRKVFEEDRVVCESVHLGAKQARVSGLLSDEEYRVCEFQRSYLDALHGQVTLNRGRAAA